MKYVIELEELKGTGLYRAKGANTLVFDERGISNILIPLDEYLKSEENRKTAFIFKPGDIIRTNNGTIEYEFMGYADNGRINCIRTDNHQFSTLRADKVVLVRNEFDEFWERLQRGENKNEF